MKLSSNSVGMLIFIALATVVFVLMVLRPAVEGTAMNLGVPAISEMSASNTNEQTETTTTTSETATTETMSAETTTDPETVTPTTEEAPTAETTEEAPSEETTTESTTTN